jgi:hypothetical protein
VKRRISPITTAIVLIVVIGIVLGLYTKGLLGGKEAEPAGGGGGGGGEEPPPPTGLATVAVTTFAGWVRPGLGDATGWDAQFNGPSGIAAAPDGSLYVADSRNHRIRLVAADGTVTTAAGSGPVDCLPGGFADGPATEAQLFNPSGVAVAPDGTVCFADTGNHRVRALKDGQVTTVAGGPTQKDELGFEQGGDQDGPATEARFRFPADVAFGPAGELVVADLGNARIRRIANGTVTTMPAGGALKAPTGLAFGLSGSLAVADPGAGAVLEMGAVPEFSARSRTGNVPKSPTAVCAMGEGALAVADAEWHAIFAMTSERSVLLAGILTPQPSSGHTDGNGAEARFSRPCALAYANGTLYVADFGNNCIRALTIPPDWATPLPTPEEDARARWERRRQWRRREGDRPGDRSQRPDQDLRGRRPGPQTD